MMTINRYYSNISTMNAIKRLLYAGTCPWESAFFPLNQAIPWHHFPIDQPNEFFPFLVEHQLSSLLKIFSGKVYFKGN